MKQSPLLRNSIIIGAILLLLAGAFVLVMRMSPMDNQTAATPQPTFTAYQIEQTDIQTITISDSEIGQIRVERAGEQEWTINNVAYTEIDPSKVSGLLSTVSTITSKYEIEKNPADLSEYGLSKPKLTIEVEQKAGARERLLIGEQSPTTGEYFFFVEGSDTVYSIAAYKVDTFRKPLSYYESFNRFSINTADVSELILERQDKDTLQIKLKDNAADIPYNIWNVLKPYPAILNGYDELIESELLTPISQLSVTEKAPEGKQYGLDAPRAKLTIMTQAYLEDGTKGESSTKTLNIGNSEGGITYVSLSDKPGVYTVENNQVAFVQIDAFQLVSKLQAFVDISEVTKLTVSAEGKEYTMDIAHGEDNSMTFQLNGKDADEKQCKALYQSVIGMQVDSTYQGEAMQAPEVTVTFQGDKTTAVTFSSINELSYAVTRDGQTLFTIKKSKVNDMLQQFASQE